MMKPRYFFKAFLLLLALFLLFSCKPASGGPDETSVPSTEAKTGFDVTADFVLIRNEYSTDGVEAARYLRTAFSELFGTELTLGTDFVKRGEEVVPGEYEILVGKTGRPAAGSLYGGLRARDWSYEILNDGCLVIAGGNSESTLEAAKAFLKDAFGYTGPGTGAKKTLEAGFRQDFKYEYPVKELSLNGTDFADWGIVYMNTGWKTVAQDMAASLADPAGIEPPVEFNLNTKSKHNIYLRQLGSSPKNGYDVMIHADDKGDIYLEGNSEDTIQRAVALFLKEVLPEKYTAAMKLTFEKEIGVYSFASPEYDRINPAKNEKFRYENGLTLVKQEESKVSEGIRLLRLEYKDYEGGPVVAFLMICEPGTVTPYCGLPNAADTIGEGVKQNVLDQAVAYQNKYGVDIVGGINGDLFFSATEPVSNPFHLGKRLTSATGPVFARMKDGTYFIGYDNEIDFSNVEEAVGGRYLALKNGGFADLTPGDDLIYYRHPRSCVGTDPEGRLYLLVVDGRQSGYSGGCSIPDMGVMLLPFGATDAINFDGGGSATMIVKDYANGQLSCRNKPSDGKMRAVLDTLLLVRNPDNVK
ncbi:MAG: phosphodiester glycosidase family protein [Lachnospiraceae bacterium]|nr:phosphodiester glycosidase family protein [Lachnospiraceae bacterium]